MRTVSDMDSILEIKCLAPQPRRNLRQYSRPQRYRPRAASPLIPVTPVRVTPVPVTPTPTQPPCSIFYNEDCFASRVLCGGLNLRQGRAGQGRAGQGQNLRPPFGVDALRWSRFQAIEIDVNHGCSDLAEEHSGRRRDGDGAMRYAPGRTGTAHPVETEGVNLSGEQPALSSCWPDTALCWRGSRRENCSSNTPVRWVGGGLPEAEIGTVAALGRGATTSVSVKPGVS